MSEEKKEGREGASLSFTDFVDQLDMGQCGAECSRALREVIARNAEIATENGKASGSLTVTFTFATAGQSGQTDIGYAVSGKPAARPTAKTVLYATPKGGLTAQDPRQKKFQWAEKPKTPANANANASSTGDNE